jgi:hypothetical protein
MANNTYPTLLRLVAIASFGGLFLFAQRSAQEFTAPGSHRVTVTLVDSDTGEPLAARVSFTDAEGTYYPPLGHPWSVSAALRGGDLALPNGETYAYVDGEFEVELPDGEITVKAVHGLEYDVYESNFEIEDGGLETLRIPLTRWSDIAERGWIAGDTHIHFPNPRAAMTEMKAEGLNVTNLLVLKGGVGNGERPGDGQFQNVEHFDGRLSRLSTDKHFLYTSEEFRNHFLGHLIFLNLKRLIWPVSTGELPENGWGGFALPTHADAAELARQQDGLVIWAHFPYPNGECPVDVALGKIDAFDILTTGNPFQLHPTLQRIYGMYGPRVYDMAPIDLYYAYLNAGFRIRASSGSDKMGTAVPMGSARTYVATGSNRDYASWIEGIRQGHTFISTGPIIEISVDGNGPGAEMQFESTSTSRKVRVTAKSQSRMAYDTLEIIHNGEVVASATPTGDHYSAEIDVELEIDRSGWIAARSYGQEMLPYGGPPGHWFRMPVFAHTNPVHIEIEGRPIDVGSAPELFLEQIEYHRKYVMTQGRYPSDAARQHALNQIDEAVEVYRSLETR